MAIASVLALFSEAYYSKQIKELSSMSYPPPGESPSDLWLERSNLAGAVLGGVAYGEDPLLLTDVNSTCG